MALAIVKDALPKKVLFDVVYGARLLERSVAIVEKTSAYNPSIVRLGRDLYYNMRNLSPGQALEESNFALLAALAAEDEAQ